MLFHLPTTRCPLAWFFCAILLSASLGNAYGNAFRTHATSSGPKKVLRLQRKQTDPFIEEALEKNIFALTLCSQQRDEAALSCFRNALRTLDSAPPHEHVRGIIESAINSNIAKTYHRLGQLESAEPYYYAALAMRKDVFGPDSELAAIVHLQLAVLRYEQSNYRAAHRHLDKAEVMFSRSTKQAKQTRFVCEEAKLPAMLRKVIGNGHHYPEKASINRIRTFLLEPERKNALLK